MATHPATPYQTSLSAAVTADSNTIKTAASTGFAVGSYVVVGREVMLLTTVDTTNHVHAVKRGMKGSQAKTHPSSAIVTLGTAGTFGNVTASGVEIAGYVGNLGTPTLPIGSRWVDPETGYEYILCDSGATYTLGEWVVISPAGAATILAATSQGRVGIVAETVSASDKLFWVMVVGTSADGYCSSAITTAAPVTAGAGIVDASSSGVNNPVVRGVHCTADHATSCTITQATFYLNNPWVSAGDILVS